MRKHNFIHLKSKSSSKWENRFISL